MIRQLAKNTVMVDFHRDSIQEVKGFGSNRSFNFQAPAPREIKRDSLSYKEAEDAAFEDLTLP